MQLEMSNQDSERDSEKLISTQRQLEERITQISNELTAVKESNARIVETRDEEIAELNGVVKRIESEKAQLDQRIDVIQAENDQLSSRIDQLEGEKMEILA